MTATVVNLAIPVATYPVNTNGEEKKVSNQEIKIKYPDGLTKRYILASAAIPAYADFADIDDIDSHGYACDVWW